MQNDDRRHLDRDVAAQQPGNQQPADAADDGSPDTPPALDQHIVGRPRAVKDQHCRQIGPGPAVGVDPVTQRQRNGQRQRDLNRPLRRLFQPHTEGWIGRIVGRGRHPNPVLRIAERPYLVQDRPCRPFGPPASVEGIRQVRTAGIVAKRRVGGVDAQPHQQRGDLGILAARGGQAQFGRRGAGAQAALRFLGRSFRGTAQESGKVQQIGAHQIPAARRRTAPEKEPDQRRNQAADKDRGQRPHRILRRDVQIDREHERIGRGQRDRPHAGRPRAEDEGGGRQHGRDGQRRPDGAGQPQRQSKPRQGHDRGGNRLTQYLPQRRRGDEPAQILRDRRAQHRARQGQVQQPRGKIEDAVGRHRCRRHHRRIPGLRPPRIEPIQKSGQAGKRHGRGLRYPVAAEGRVRLAERNAHCIVPGVLTPA
ncbi:hypothetical protein OCGS_2186 [Oceaniovalibus guishaninsula JLT2003]|uniref:Uncharacterized protein n=1 Tax=Oceaniovalibus guishaninsula JLT2003 TaxID=1231392 RepID=K2HB02_9RHOB|nr:hypothetical protein OCGS_2186 [Oceaniovalibus guishaninsula JLT2003]